MLSKVKFDKTKDYTHSQIHEFAGKVLEANIERGVTENFGLGNSKVMNDGDYWVDEDPDPITEWVQKKEKKVFKTTRQTLKAVTKNAKKVQKTFDEKIITYMYG